MTRGLMKSASIFALGMALSVSANAADLGGNCCADLEERVAELEATTVRKGNRKVSVQLYGWVNKTIMSWDAPVRTSTGPGAGGELGLGTPTSGTYLGLDNTNSATRFGIRGNAKINGEWTAGYSILLDVFSGGTTARASRVSEDGGTVVGGSTNDDYLIRMRDSNLWMESNRIGRVTLGRFTGAGAVGVIDLGGIGNVASGGVSLVGNNLTFANGRTLGNATDQVGDFGYRQEGIKWDLPALAGFTVSASYGETTKDAAFTGLNGPQPHGKIWGASLRYANEFNGVRVAAGIGYEKVADDASTIANVDGSNFGGSIALLHVATGLFIQADYVEFDRTFAPGATREGDRFIVQAGLKRNFFGIGDTVLYGEYAKHKGMADVFNAAVIAGTASDAKLWGLGVVQNIDAAAMELYAGYRKHSYSEAGLSQGDIGIFMAGARINF